MASVGALHSLRSFRRRLPGVRHLQHVKYKPNKHQNKMHGMNSRFRKRIANQSATIKIPKKANPPPRGKPLLEALNQIAQICLAVVAIFGYFYTVLPVYQKERLAEQVAEYEGIIKKQAPKIAAAEEKLGELEREHSRLTTEVKKMEQQLASTRDQKKKIENQIQYMDFKYVLPDGTPATTPQQVQSAQLFQLKKSYISALRTSCTFGFSGEIFPSSLYLKEEESKSWPFSEKEANAWKTYGAALPAKKAVDCINNVSKDFSTRYGSDQLSKQIGLFQKVAVAYANMESTKKWAPPIEPSDLWQELSTKRAEIDAEFNSEIKKVEEEYGDWESTFGEARRAIFKHNYTVGKQNAKSQVISKKLSLEYNIQKKANDLRKSLNDEVKRLIITEIKE